MGGDDGKVSFFTNDGDANIFDFSLTDDDFFKKATKKFYSAASHGRGGGGGSGARAVAVGITAASLLALRVLSNMNEASKLQGMKWSVALERTWRGA